MSRGATRVRAAGVIALLFVAASTAAVLAGPRRHVPRSVAVASVGSVRLDSGASIVALTATEDLRIDGAVESFADFSGRIAVAPNGNIVVPQGSDYQYRFYAPDGRRIATLGQRGSGPGDFRTFETRFGWTGDTLWIWDNSLDRITYVSSDGRYLDSETFRAVFAAPRDWGRYPAVMEVAAVEAIRGGDYFVWGREWALMLPESWLAMRRPMVAVGALQVVHRVVGNFPFLGDSDAVRRDVGDVRPYEMPLPLRAPPRFGVAADGSRFAYLTTHVESGHGGRLDLTIIAASGDTLVRRAYEFAGDPIPGDVADSILSDRIARQQREPPAGVRVFPGREEARDRWIAAARRLALPVYAPVEALVLGRDSTTWIGLRAVAAQRTWLVLDAGGAPVASLTLPGDVRLSVAERGYAWGVQPDSNDVLSVVRYRVTGW